MNGLQRGFPGAGRVAAPRGGWGCPEEGMEFGSIPLCHPRSFPVGAPWSGAKERLITV